jgi:plastocyanin
MKRPRVLVLTVIVAILLVTASYYYLVSAQSNSVTVTIAANDGPQGDGVGFVPTNFTVKEGQSVTIVFVNHGSRPHQLFIPVFHVSMGIVVGGATTRVSFTPNMVGTFSFGEPPGTGLDPDRGNGMVGNVTVLSE